MAQVDLAEMSSTLPGIFFDRACRYGRREALLYKDKTSGSYQAWTWDNWKTRVEQTAAGLFSLGVRRGDRVGLLSENRPEWTVADLGILSLGAVTVPVYPTSSPKEVAHILNDAGIRFLFLSNSGHYERLKEFVAGANVVAILFDETPAVSGGALKLEELSLKGKIFLEGNSDAVQDWVRETGSDDLATLIYTSGTTGPPKGVMLTHRNFIANYLGAAQVIQVDDSDLALSFLPLSHVFERLAGYYFMIFNGARIAYAESMQTVPEDLVQVRPTVAASVPRLYEKMYLKIQESMKAASPVKKHLFDWALSIGRECLSIRTAGRVPNFLMRLKYGLADRLVFRKLKDKLGGRMRFFISGGAPLAKELGEFFGASGVLILEGYGLTETSPVIAVNSEAHVKYGTVGRPLPNVEVRIAADGEILTRGPCVMKGYYKNEAATAAVFEGEWFKTGDIGEIDAEGFLKITDRKKDLIVTSGGKNISPQNIENMILMDPSFLQVVVIGDKRNYLVALIVPQKKNLEDKALELGIGELSWTDKLRHPAILAWAEAKIQARTRDLARYEQIKYFTFLEKELSLEAGELTPTLKVKRKIIMERFAPLIDAMYEKGDAQKLKD